ncbi:uncharacterized protein LOC6565263 [Drosophila grimshawi]|uniref:Gamma-tubulin complex component n=1 Tax=Drosophila grimshawi TaxID=7222 RepID=B4JJ67_DROGR|nr:uncharacterized protein LOC6565263 [Drosophila grimshawi]XP_043072308.1 uncharacterized protein LOC6565263 [Drosophila grimshawi]EDV99619.1 GH12439 [Drosophila grimshawi]
MSKDASSAFVQQNVRKLVKCLAGGNSTKSQRRTLEQYGLHKVQIHRSLAINRHEVRRSVDNMIERFRCEGMPHQASALRYLSTLIMDHDLWKSLYVTDVQYSVIDFLLSVTYAPIQTVRRNRRLMDLQLLVLKHDLERAPTNDKLVNQSLSNPAEADVDWVAVLTEDFDKESLLSSDSNSSLSDWSDDEESFSTENTMHEIEEEESSTSLQLFVRNFPCHSTESTSFDGTPKRSSWCKLPTLSAVQAPSALPTYTKFIAESTNLSTKVHSYWWLQHVKCYSYTMNFDPLANFASAYVQYMNPQTQRLLPKTIDEHSLIREIIFMFFMPASCCFFRVHPESMEISVCSDVSICSVSNGTLKTVLEAEVLPAMQAMQQLRQIVKEHTLLNDHTPTSGTLQCFAVGLRDVIQPIEQRLIAFERQLLDCGAGITESSLTLIAFVRHMDVQFKQLQVIQSLAANAIVTAPPHLRSAYLLSHLFKHTKMHVPNQKMAMALLLITLKRYCTIIDNWWRSGNLKDSRHEFIMECSRDDSVYAVQSVRERCRTEDPKDVHRIILKELRDCKLYHLLMEHALQFGETQNLLGSHNLLGELIENSKQVGSLHSDLIKELFDELKSFGCVACPVGRRRTSVLDDVRQNWQQDKALILQRFSELGDPQLMGFFTQHLKQSQREQVQMEQRTPPLQVLDILEALEICTPLQLPQVLPRALAKVLRNRIELANVFVMRWYREELLLGEHVRFLRHLLMLEADYLLYPFYTWLYRKIESGEQWARTSDLTKYLYTVLDPHYPAMASDIYVEIISRMRSQSIKVFEALEAIEVKYTMPQALSTIVTEENMKCYNDIWRLLLKIKWAAWKLENMRFIRRNSKDLYAPLDLLGLTVRRLEMLRFWMINLISSLHTHLCTHVIHAMGMHFELELKKTRNIRELTKLHKDYLLQLSRHCLLTKEFEDFRSALEQIFHLVFVLDMEWHSCTSYLNDSHALSIDPSFCGGDSSYVGCKSLDTSEVNNGLEYLALSQVGEIEGTYKRCHQLLASTLTTLVYKDDHKIFSSLELALSSSVPC